MPTMSGPALACVDCGKTSREPPKDAPNFFEEIWPEEKRVLSSQLQADHESKDLTNNAVEDLNWRCPSCHKKADQKTESGVSQSQNEVYELF